MPQTADFTATSPDAAKIVVGPASAPTTEAVATSQVVLGMPREMARAIGWPKALTPATTQNLLNRDVTWKSLGHPEWGSFRITSADPTKSLVGAVGFGALTTLANGGKFLTKAPNYANPTKADYAVVHTEQRIETVTDTQDAADAVMNVDTVAKFVKSTSAVVTTERAVIAHNQAFPGNPFVAVPLLDGAASVPIVVTPAESAGADGKAFAQFLTSPAGAAALRDAGYRSLMGQEPSVGAAGIAPTSTGPFPFTQEMVDGIHSAWSLMHARNSTLAVIDLSGSMRYPFGDSKVSKINLVRQLAARAFDLASPRANSSVWFFHTIAGKPVIVDDLPLQRNDIAIGGGKVHSDAIKAQIATAQPGGGTPLFRAVQDAFGEANRKYQDGYLNQVLIISDGNNEDSGSNVTLAKLSAYIKANYDKDKPVVVNFFLIDPGVNLGPLKKVAGLTGGIATHVTKMSQVPDAFAQALFSS